MTRQGSPLKSIRQRLLLLVFLALLPAFLAAGWVVALAYQNEKELLENSLRNTTRALSWVVARDLTRRADLARVLADSPLLDAGAASSAQDLAQFSLRVQRAIAPMAGWAELHSSKGLLLSTRALPAGASVASTKLEASPLEDSPTIRSLQDAGDGAGLLAHVVHPVRRGGQTEINLKLTILPQEMQALIDQQELPPDAVATILDDRGTVIARHPNGAKYLGAKATPDMLEMFKTQTEGLFESISLDGVPTVGYFASSPQGWTYLTALPRDQYKSSVPNAVGPLLVFATWLLALALGGALWVARGIAEPVLALKQLASRMRAGKITEDRPSGIAEIDQVATALHQTAAELHGARENLERQVQGAVTRTKIAEQRISQGLRVEALGRLTGGVAHDFNNLLGIISNNAHLIQRQDQENALQAPLSATLRAVDVGSRLTQNLMRFAGRQRVRAVPLEICPHLDDAQALIRIVLGSRVQLCLQCPPGLPRITVDASELELALINLALNAREAMPEGGQVHLDARMADAVEKADLPPGQYLRLAMSDNGSGIDPGMLTHIFEPFFTTKPAGKGTGLGLSQVYGFCQQAGGSATISSRPGEGATVSMLLPVTAQRVALDASHAPTRKSPRSRPIDGLRLLLVEDNPDLAETTEHLLRAQGFRVARALSAAQALKYADDGEPFDLVLSDVVMPGEMDGLMLARRLRLRYPRLPIVLISGYSTALVEEYDFTVLHKPCAPGELVAALRQAIDEAAASDFSPLV